MKKKKEKRKKDVHLPKIAWHKSWKKKNLLSPLLEFRDVPRKYFNSNYRRSVQSGNRSMNSLRTQI